MSDNLFDQLFELLQSPGPVNWKLAHEVLKSVAPQPQPLELRLVEEYQELALAAEMQTQNISGLTIEPGAPMHPVDERTWAVDNEQSFRFIVEPLAEKLEALGGGEGQMAAALRPLGPALLGMQMGSLVGSMAHRVLGQFDAGIPTLDHDRRYLVVPNVEAFAVENSLDARQVRLWASLREIVNHGVLQVPWLRARLIEIVADFYADLEFQPEQLMDRIARLQQGQDIDSFMGESPALPAILGGEQDADKADRINAHLVLIEGFSEYGASRVGHTLLPDLAAIESAAQRRRTEPSQAMDAIQQLTGLSMERHRVADAAGFCAEVARRWGDESLAVMWEDAANLPNLREITDPVGWAARVLLH